MKKIVVFIFMLLFLCSCSNKHENDKIAYLEYKNSLEEQNVFSDIETLPFNVFFNINRIGEEVKYHLTINNANINMHNVKALLIHDYMNEDVYPSIGILDESTDLLVNDNNEIKLEGTIYSTNDINNVNFRLYLEYTDDDNNVNKIYYEVRRG